LGFTGAGYQERFVIFRLAGTCGHMRPEGSTILISKRTRPRRDDVWFYQAEGIGIIPTEGFGIDILILRSDGRISPVEMRVKTTPWRPAHTARNQAFRERGRGIRAQIADSPSNSDTDGKSGFTGQKRFTTRR